ncbi:MAG: ribose-phosphate pyrophosphokinase [Planctomycetes bacterium]|nr:ribose-phosphate pyrophosphokinase [Planctomycetota bacterium]MCP4771785.1 ribose-phosphate pyrophosphokinase [Planctomycetota bacterium]MCP4860972.1 ribose-phosphate pyrophosphokinase [Planctomycetota bacterium]
MSYQDSRLKLLSGSAHPELANEIASYLDVPMSSASVGRFPDGEIDIKLHEDIRGSDVFVVQPTGPPVNENIIELLLMVDTLRRASAGRITAVIPYFGYARKDRKDEGRVPISAKVIANMLVGSGVDRVLTIDLHAQQIQGFFDIPVDHLWARGVLEETVHGMNLNNLVVCSPDVGGVKLARAWAKSLHAPLAIVDKRRTSGTTVVMENVIGDIEGCNVLLSDDMISTAGTITEASRILKEKGAKRVIIAATHAVLCGPAVERLQNCAAEKVLVSNTMALRGELPDNLEVVSVAPLLARAITRIHREESVSALFEDENIT